MKPSRRIALCIFFAGLFVPAVTHAGTSEVFGVQTRINGVIERFLSNTVISKVVISADDFINLARQRTLGTPVPGNEILALTSDCPSNNLRLIIFDTDTSSNLVTLGTLNHLTTAVYTRRRYMETITQISLDDTSDGTNGITGGSFYYHSRINLGTNNCPTKFSGQLTGLLGTTFPLLLTNHNCTNFVTQIDPGTNCVTNCVTVLLTNCVLDGTITVLPTNQTFDVIIPRAPLATGKPIGTLIEE